MTHAWVVYESMYGNTREIAEAVAQGVKEWSEVEVHEVSAASSLPPGVDLVIVGAPTHAFGLSRPSTRADAAQRAHRRVESETLGLREWLDRLELPSPAPRFAAFDTQVSRPRLPGSAARKAAKRLRQKGAEQIVDPQSFWVEGSEGPLGQGELERARAWGDALAARAVR